jgi:hypothetical protein
VIVELGVLALQTEFSHLFRSMFQVVAPGYC